jgi:hypothetical protein
LTQSIYKKRFLKRPIYKKPCNYAGCNKVIHTRSFNRKFCYRHGPNFKYKISKLSKEKRKLANSPYTKVVQQVRKCLKCNNKFDSISYYNRICNSCNIENESIKSAKSFHGWKLAPNMVNRLDIYNYKHAKYGEDLNANSHVYRTRWGWEK